MATIVVFQHEASQHPGRLGATLRDHAFRLDVRRLDLPADDAPPGVKTTVPPDLDGVQGVVSLGFSGNTTDPRPWIDAERAYLKAAHEAGLPVVGVCFGHQLLAEALGGEVGAMDQPECGFADVTLAGVPAQTDTILAGVAWKAPQFHSHGHEVKTPPPGSQTLGSSAACKAQILKHGPRSYGFQYHFECDRTMIERFPGDQHELWTRAGVSVEALAGQLETHEEMFARLGDRLCVNLAAYAFPFSSLTAV